MKTIQEKLSETVFKKYFKNRKSKASVKIYWEFYGRLWNYVHEEKNSEKLDDLLTFYEDNRAMLNKAFGRGQNIRIQPGEYLRLPVLLVFITVLLNWHTGNFVPVFLIQSLSEVASQEIDRKKSLPIIVK